MYKLLDLYCCCGLASEGYARAGFEVFGIDNDAEALRHYEYNSLNLDILSIDETIFQDFDIIAASPPCQAHSVLRYRTGREYVDLVPYTREMLIKSGKPFIIENVESNNEHLINPIALCGSMFNLGAVCKDGKYRQLKRHRLFESNFQLTAPGPCQHINGSIGVMGDGGGGQMKHGYKGYAKESREAMGINRIIPRKYLSQGIPPAYTEHLGKQAIEYLESKNV